MAQSLSSILIHLVFSTKNREPFITTAIETELHPYMATIFRDRIRRLAGTSPQAYRRVPWESRELN